ncbi:hypothetical protein [Selenomonas flueggei]|uniref:Uncharacterized protein n=1 Tax=Selenomonas flueggei ATCC 43531 TaxID=638302 RepID=C4V4T6_9FIRM|nr:hypothetical protein [Selenomonas flueggei]EEQ48183.1 hypothetical protein HMPREF0908_1520 [Selenomonas flueggei ATCC 43531]
MGEQKKLSVRDVLWRKKRARDKTLDVVGELCDEAWAAVDKIAADRSAAAKDAANVREIGLRLRALGYLIEGEHYIDRIAFELRSREVYLTANEVAQAYVSEMVVSFLDGILSYVKQCKWDDKELQDNYVPSLEQSLGEIRQAVLPVPVQEERKDTED